MTDQDKAKKGDWVSFVQDNQVVVGIVHYRRMHLPSCIQLVTSVGGGPRGLGAGDKEGPPCPLLSGG